MAVAWEIPSAIGVAIKKAKKKKFFAIEETLWSTMDMGL